MDEVPACGESIKLAQAFLISCGRDVDLRSPKNLRIASQRRQLDNGFSGALRRLRLLQMMKDNSFEQLRSSNCMQRRSMFAMGDTLMKMQSCLCASPQFRRAGRKGFMEKNILWLVYLFPWKCTTCKARVMRFVRRDRIL